VQRVTSTQKFAAWCASTTGESRRIQRHPRGGGGVREAGCRRQEILVRSSPSIMHEIVQRAFAARNSCQLCW